MENARNAHKEAPKPGYYDPNRAATSIALCDADKFCAFDYYPSPKVLSLVSQAEQHACQAECMIARNDIADTVNEYLIDLDTVASGRISGRKETVSNLLRERLLSFYTEYNVHFPEELHQDSNSIPGEIAGYGASLRDLSQHGSITIDESLLFDWHRALSPHDAKNSYRTRAAHPGQYEGYQPPSPESIGPLTQDVLSFCNETYSTPIIHAGIAHFRFEAIRPFSTSMDYLGRLLSHSILYRRKLQNKICLPIGMRAGIFVEDHARGLFPYRAKDETENLSLHEAIDRFIGSCSTCVDYAAQIALQIAVQLSTIRARWSRRVGRTRSDSALQKVMEILPSTPFFNVDYLELATNRSRTALNSAISTLETAQIIRQISAGRRSRFFEATDIARFIKQLDNDIFPQAVTSREDFAIHRFEI